MIRASRQPNAPDQWHEENGDIDRKSKGPQDRAQRRAVAEIGENISNSHDQEQDRKLIDQPLWAKVKLSQQHGNCKERERLDPVLMRGQCARADRISIERGVARSGVIELSKRDRLWGGDGEQVERQCSENAPFGDRHDLSPTRGNVSARVFATIAKPRLS